MTNSNDNENYQLLDNLSALELNFNAIEPVMRRVYKTFSPPHISEVEDYWKQKKSWHPLLQEMLNGNSAMQLYGAILLSQIDFSQATEVLEKLKTDSAKIKVQKKIGHGSFEVSVKHLAESFLKYKNIRLGYLQKFEKISLWQIAIFQEAREKRLPPEIENLPTIDEFYESQNNSLKKEELLSRTLLLRNDSIIAKRFYAAEILAEIDFAESQNILQNLTNEETPILVIFGDIATPIPAGEMALSILENRQPKINVVIEEDESTNFFGKIKRLFFR